MLPNHALQEGADSARSSSKTGGQARTTQLKAALQGMGFDAQVEVLTPRADQAAAVQQCASAEPERPAAPVQRRATRHVQRRSLEQAGLTAGLADAGASAVVGLPFQVKKYRIVVPKAQALPGRVEALAKAAELNGGLGEKLNAACTSKTCVFTKKETEFNKATNKDTIDPFILEISVPFTKDGGDHTVTCEYQHARAFSGYVSKVTDSSNAAMAGGAQMAAAPKGAAVKAGEYPVDHNETDNGANIAGQTAGDDHKAADAYTKIAGEGARWECVRRHASNIQNNSLFFTARADDPTKVWGIEFSILWRNWDTGFDKAYNIKDAKVAAELVGGTLKALRVGVDRTALTGKDYDLDKGAAHVAAPPPPPAN